MFVKAEFFSQ